ncbi:AAA family ATPase [Merismopedia glauca]|uniref:Uncharacterized protein n=1 Tax=Merismopedia glauca CCAP 1448/3 TaxID=1296344 RepID=A0A2T1BWL3_9CYAN|nr:AAA family ATPase [Merismopedia glauca]PSB00409.1 hypothetical protein C7B64_23665 [Merismopedia glauca CCAP 1448/3]
MPPELIMFAGPNGSGKSTVTNSYRSQPGFPEIYVNPDEIALTLPGTSMEKAYRAAQIADSQREECIKRRHSFAFETVASHPSKYLFLQKAREAGYETSLIFISTSDPQYNVSRVKQRVASGGHDVPEDKIVSRYYRSLQLLALGAEIASNTIVIDNTGLPLIMATASQGKIIALDSKAPDWVTNYFVEPLARRSQERREIESIAANLSLRVGKANLSGSHSGEIVGLTQNYALQRISDERSLIHELVAIGDSIRLGEYTNISYQDGAGTAIRAITPDISIMPDLSRLDSEQDLDR